MGQRPGGICSHVLFTLCSLINPESIDDMEESYALCCSVQSMTVLRVLILSSH